MRIAGVYGQAFVFNRNDRELAMVNTCTTDLASLYTEHGFVLSLGYSDEIVDVYEGIRSDRLRGAYAMTLGFQLTHDGVLHSWGRLPSEKKTDEPNPTNVLYRRVLHGPDTRRMLSSDSDSISDALEYALDHCKGDHERAFDAFCEVVSMPRDSMVFLPFSVIQAELVRLGYTKTAKLPDLIPDRV